MSLEWMAWTWPTAAFFACVALMLAVMTVLQIVRPTVERRGFLVISTTRGDRLFVGLVGSAYIHLAWLGLTSLPLWWASLIALAWMAIVLRWG